MCSEQLQASPKRQAEEEKQSGAAYVMQGLDCIELSDSDYIQSRAFGNDFFKSNIIFIDIFSQIIKVPGKD